MPGGPQSWVDCESSLFPRLRIRDANAPRENGLEFDSILVGLTEIRIHHQGCLVVQRHHFGVATGIPGAGERRREASRDRRLPIEPCRIGGRSHRDVARPARLALARIAHRLETKSPPEEYKWLK